MHAASTSTLRGEGTMLRPSRNVVRAAVRALRSGTPTQAAQPRHSAGASSGVIGGSSSGTFVADASSRRHRHLHGWTRRPLAATAPSTTSTRQRSTTVAADAATHQPAPTADTTDDAHADGNKNTANTDSSSSSSSRRPQTSITAPQKLPAFDYTALVASVCEIHNLAVPTKVELAVQADAYTLVLGLRGLEGKLALHVSWHPDAARVSLGPPPPRVHKTEQLSFGEQCHANLRGLILVSASIPDPWERVATFSFAERPGAEPTFHLHCEVMARNSNAVLVQAAGTGGGSNNNKGGGGPNIVSCAYQVGAAQTSVRPMSPGFAYTAPPPAPGIPPDDASVSSQTSWSQTVTAATALVAEQRNAPSTTKKYKNENARRKAEARAAKAGVPGIEKGMVRAFRGVSPALASALAVGAGVSPTALPDELDDDAWRRLYGEWCAWMASCTAAVDVVNEAAGSSAPAPPPKPGEMTPASIALSDAGWYAAQGQLLLHVPGGRGGGGGGGTDTSTAEAQQEEGDEEGDEGAVAAAAAAPSTSYEPLSAASAAADPSAAGGPVGALFAAVYGGAGDADVFRRERERLLQGVRAASKKNGQKVKAFQQQIDSAAKHEEVKNKADEIMAYQHGYKEGDTSLEVYDFETGEAKRVDIDPLKGPMVVAEALYKKARKQRRTAAAVEPLLEAAAAEAEYLAQVEFALTELTGDSSSDGGGGGGAGVGSEDMLALEEIALELVEAKLMAPTGKGAAAQIKQEEKSKKKGGGKQGNNNKKKGGGGGGGGKRGRKEDAMANIRVYTAPSGREVLVGRNSKGNEAVSLRIGQDQDVWFHVRGAPGAHVILRLQPGEEATEEDMTCAANLAAFHSKLRTGGKVDVSWTSPKFVRKPSGGRLGMVTIDKESVMIGRPDDCEAAAEEARERARGGGKKGGTAAGSW